MTVWEFFDKTAFHTGAILVLFFCILYMELKWHINPWRKAYFVYGLAIIIIQALASILITYGTDWLGPLEGRLAAEMGNYIYFVFHAILAPFLYVYALFVTQIYTRISLKARICSLIPYAIAELIMVINPLTHWGWYFDDDFVFHRGWGEYYLYIIGVLYITLGLWIIVERWGAITVKRRLILAASFAFTGLGLVIQFIVPAIEVELFSESLTMLGIMLSIEYDDDRIDPVSKVYNRSALIQDVSSFLLFRSNYCIVVFRAWDIKYLNRTLGLAVEDIQEQIGNRLSKVYPRYRIYRATSSSFMMYLPSGDKNGALTLAEDIKEAFMTEVEVAGMSVPIRFTLACAIVPEELNGVDDILLLCETEMPAEKSGMILSGDDLRYLYQREKLDQAIHRGIENHSFKMEYQLIYTPDDLNVCAAESLLRLEDEELGVLYPDDFIPAAERNGLIDRLGTYVLSEVCTFISGGVPEWSGIKYISVNLSIIQCMDVDFADRAIGLVQSYGVDPSMINFEITESVASTDYSYVARVIRSLKEKGFMVSMQGYGSGNTDLYSLFSMGFDVIKLDKQLLWQADMSEEGMIVFRNSVNMIRELGRTIVAVGIETVDQMRNARAAGVDSVQGYYFSAPMSADDLLNLVER